MSEINDKETDFHLKEFELLRDEMRKRSDEQVATEKLTIFSVAAIYSFIAALYKGGAIEEFANIADIIWWIPPLLISYGLLRWQANDDMIQLLGKYIRLRSEDVLAGKGGWENFHDPAQYLDSDGSTRRAYESHPVYIAQNIRKFLLEDRQGFSRVWPVMEVFRMIILIATILIAIIQSV